MTLGHLTRPDLPVRIQLGQGIVDSHQLMAGQQFPSPGRYAGAALEHRHQWLATTERGVEGRQIGDLEGDDHDPGSTGGDIESDVGRSTGVYGSYREERGERLAKSVRDRMRGVHEHQTEADDQAGGPEQQLSDEGDRGRRGEYRVLRFVGTGKA